jgi:hypothetical protein
VLLSGDARITFALLISMFHQRLQEDRTLEILEWIKPAFYYLKPAKARKIPEAHVKLLLVTLYREHNCKMPKKQWCNTWAAGQRGINFTGNDVYQWSRHT